MDDRFYNGVIGASTKVCGYRIDALTPWHHILLSAVDSPVLVPERATDTGDLIVFLKIVQSKWPETPELKPTLSDVWWTWRMKKVKTAKRQMRRMRGWLEAQMAMPKLWENHQQSGSNLSTPPMFALIACLVSKGGIGLYEAWNMRTSEARWYDVALAELNGAALKIADDNEEMPSAKIKHLNEEEIQAEAKKSMTPAQYKIWREAYKRNK